jgi:hypothetical protein
VLAAPAAPAVAVPAAASRPSSERRTARLLALLVLLACGTALVWAMSTPDQVAATAMAGVGRFARPVPTVAGDRSGPTEPVMGGLGRFAHHRTGPPPPLG